MRSTASFDAFYASRAPLLLRSVYLRTGDLSRAEECVQEAFVRAWQRWKTLDNDDPVGWVTTVAWRLAISDWHRSKRESRAWNARPQSAAIEQPPDDLLDLQSLLRNLPVMQRDVLILHYLEDMSVAGIADFLDMPHGTVKSHLSRGRTAIRLLSANRGAAR